MHSVGLGVRSDRPVLRRALYLVASIGVGLVGAVGLLLVWLLAGRAGRGVCEDLNGGRPGVSDPDLVPVGVTCTYSKGPVSVIEHTSWALTLLQLVPVALGLVATTYLWRAVAPSPARGWVRRQPLPGRLVLLVAGWFTTVGLALLVVGGFTGAGTALTLGVVLFALVFVRDRRVAEPRPK